MCDENLCDFVHAETMLSHPDEYFNVLTLKESLRHNKARDIYSYYDVVANKVTSPAGVFGFQISFFDLEIIEREAGLLSLVTGEKFFFVLMRKNFVAQAISMYLATLTGVFHVTDVNHINKIDHSSITIVYEEIKKWILHILAQEYGINQWVARKNISVTRFWYEDISLDVEKSIQVIADTLNCALPAYRKIEINKNVKLRDGRSDRIESIFRNKYTEFCNYWEVARGQEPCA